MHTAQPQAPAGPVLQHVQAHGAAAVHQQGTPQTAQQPALCSWQQYSSVFTNEKAGMQMVDKEKVKKIVFEMSKDSAHFKNEQRKQAQVDARIAQLKARAACLSQAELAAHQKACDAKLAQLEASRSLTRTWLHVDMDAFYASVEELEQPALQEQPMAVGGMGMICTANYEARKYGVRSAMPGFIARKLCPQLVFVKPDFAKYTSASEATRAVFRCYDPAFEAGSLDEAYLDVTDYCALHGMTGEQVAAELRARVQSETRLTCSVGVAPNMTLAKVASDLNKPNGQAVVGSSRDAVMAFVHDLPIRKVPGIGKVSEQTLNALGVTTCSHLLDQAALLSALFSSISAHFFLSVGLGLGQAEHSRAAAAGPGGGEAPGRKGLSCERTFGAMKEAAAMEAMADSLVQHLAADMAAEGIEAKTLTLKLKTTAFQVRTRALTLSSYVSSAPVMLPHVLKLLRAELPVEIRLMGVRGSNLRKKPGDGLAAAGGKLNALQRMILQGRQQGQQGEQGQQQQDEEQGQQQQDEEQGQQQQQEQRQQQGSLREQVGEEEEGEQQSSGSGRAVVPRDILDDGAGVGHDHSDGNAAMNVADYDACRGAAAVAARAGSGGAGVAGQDGWGAGLSGDTGGYSGCSSSRWWCEAPALLLEDTAGTPPQPADPAAAVIAADAGGQQACAAMLLQQQQQQQQGQLPYPGQQQHEWQQWQQLCGPTDQLAVEINTLQQHHHQQQQQQQQERQHDGPLAKRTRLEPSSPQQQTVPVQQLQQQQHRGDLQPGQWCKASELPCGAGWQEPVHQPQAGQQQQYKQAPGPQQLQQQQQQQQERWQGPHQGFAEQQQQQQHLLDLHGLHDGPDQFQAAMPGPSNNSHIHSSGTRGGTGNTISSSRQHSRAATWTCLACTYSSNKQLMLRCEVCDTPKGSTSAAPTGWLCSSAAGATASKPSSKGHSQQRQQQRQSSRGSGRGGGSSRAGHAKQLTLEHVVLPYKSNKR